MREINSDELKRTIFMTGGTGYLGSHLMRKSDMEALSKRKKAGCGFPSAT